MKQEVNIKKNFLRFYLDPELLTNEEAKEALRESGVNVDEIEKEGERFIKKLKAKLALEIARDKEKQFLNNLEEFKKINSVKQNDSQAKIDGANSEGENEFTKPQSEYKLAARKQNKTAGNEQKDETDDTNLLNFLKNKEK
ncbi:MAG: hypothetical protein STSR0008_24570 [Ignavibacterium sp.]